MQKLGNKLCKLCKLCKKNALFKVFFRNQSTILNSTEDLHLALNQVNFVESGSKNSVGNWNLFITFSDTYDFDPSWGSEGAATIMNNIAAYAQQGGVIVPYRVQIKIGTSFVG